MPAPALWLCSIWVSIAKAISQVGLRPPGLFSRKRLTVVKLRGEKPHLYKAQCCSFHAPNAPRMSLRWEVTLMILYNPSHRTSQAARPAMFLFFPIPKGRDIGYNSIRLSVPRSAGGTNLNFRREEHDRI